MVDFSVLIVSFLRPNQNLLVKKVESIVLQLSIDFNLIYGEELVFIVILGVLI